MKILITYFLVMLFVCPAFAFQAVSTSRSNFGASAAQDGNDKESKSSAPATRTFSTYASQQHNWSKGVETKPVQTQAVQTQSATAQVSTGTQVTATDAQFTPNIQLPAANATAQPAAGTKQGANDKEKDKKGITAKSFQTATTPKQAQDAEPQTAQQATQMNQQDAAKMMQSLQGMMSGMGGGAAGGQAGGMPDISSLMNSFGGGNPQGQQPKK